MEIRNKKWILPNFHREPLKYQNWSSDMCCLFKESGQIKFKQQPEKKLDLAYNICQQYRYVVAKQKCIEKLP